MTKKRVLSPAQKTLKFPPSVLKVKEDLRDKKDEFFYTLQKLTESEDMSLRDDLKKMWLLLKEAEIKKYGPARMAAHDSWVRHFLSCAIAYSSFPPYYYQKEADRQALIKDLKDLSSVLIRKLQSNGFNYQLGYSPEFKLLSFYTDLDMFDRREADKHKKSSPRILDLLNRLVKKAEKQISSVKAGKHDDSLPARLFISGMTHYLEGSYKEEMKGVEIREILKTATAALHNISYDDDSIRKMQEREKQERKKSDKDDDNSLFLSVE
jgi:hypothetical protein